MTQHRKRDKPLTGTFVRAVHIGSGTWDIAVDSMYSFDGTKETFEHRLYVNPLTRHKK